MPEEMRRKKQRLSAAECDGLLASATSGVLALVDANGYPYTVPLSYVYHDGAVFFHCAREGHKLDVVRGNPRASFCVIAQDDVVYERFTTSYTSIVATGLVSIVENQANKRRALELLAAKYGPDDARTRESEVEKTLSRVCILRLDVERMSGKQGLERMRDSGGA